MRTRTWVSAVAATGLLAAGAALPALAAAGNSPDGSDTTLGAEQHRMNGHGMSDMGRMHEQMMQMPEMAGMHENMMQAPGMAQMHERMMGDHPDHGTDSADHGDGQ